MRVFHLMRPDPLGHRGGDLHQLDGSVRALRELGVDAISATWDQAPNDPDIVHLYNLWLPFELHRNFFEARARWPRAKIVLSPVFWTWPVGKAFAARDRYLIRQIARSWVKSSITWPLCRRVLVRADAVLPLSFAEKLIVSRHFRVAVDERWHCVHNGIWVNDWPYTRALDCADNLREAGITSDVTTAVACIGGIYPNKNQRNLVRALAGIEDAALLLVGPKSDPEYADAVFRLAEEILPSRWSWLGQVPHDRLREVLSFVDVSVLPSFREVVGLVSMEAAAVGCEVVVSVCGGAQEYFDGTAFTCEPHDPQSIARAITAARREPKQPATRAVIERFDWSATARELAHVYTSIVT